MGIAKHSDAARRSTGEGRCRVGNGGVVAFGLVMTITDRGSPPPSSPGEPRTLRSTPALIAVLAVGAVAGLVLWLAFAATRSDGPGEPTIEEAIAAQLAEATPGPAAAAVAYQQIIQSIVVIQAERSTGTSDSSEFESSESDRPASGLGTGVITNAAGDILTALHVVNEADSINVVFADGTRSTAEVVSSDPDSDIAVLRADGSPDVIVPAVMGASRTLRIGDPILAVGTPLGLTGSLSSGVVSGLNRRIPTGDETQLEGLIQFDAAVNPGNSGGPLLNNAGQVVGVVTALANPSDDASFVGIGFAVPISTAAGTAGAPAQ